MLPGPARKLQVTERYLHQNARIAIQDVYDALIELITNSDDTYARLERKGDIEIEIERHGKRSPNIVRVRDFADGMTLEVMERKLGRFGERVSGMAEGYSVRGTNSRGAKDVAALGGVVFESIAEDGRYHNCEITPQLDFIPYGPSVRATREHRRALGIARNTGTLVTLTVDRIHTVPFYNNLKDNLRNLVPLRGIIGSPDRRVILRYVNQDRQDMLESIHL